MNKRTFRILSLALLLTFLCCASAMAAGTGDVASAVEQTWKDAAAQIKTVVNNGNMYIDFVEAEFHSLFEMVQKEPNGYLKYIADFQWIADNISSMKDKKSLLLEQQKNGSAVNKRITDAVERLIGSSAQIIEWDESLIRQLVDTVKVLSADRVRICLRGDIEIERALGKG